MLPLLEYISKDFKNEVTDKVLVIALQHILTSQVYLFKQLINSGIAPKNIYLVGKCYSTSREAFEEFKKLGINISDLSFEFDSHEFFDLQFEQYIKCFFENILQTVDFGKFKKVVLLDDGGFLISHANSRLTNFENVVGVEQTSSGYEKIRLLKLNFPVVNVARSTAKLEIESPFIAETTIKKINFYLEKYKINEPKFLIVGMGYIGQSIRKLLESNFEVAGCDLALDKCDFGGDFKDHLNKFNVIIGTSGTSSIGEEDIHFFLKDTLLISVSSSDREFPAMFFRNKIPIITDCHEDIKFGNAILLNCGFPITFNNGEAISTSLEKIQITMALLYSGVMEAVDKTFESGLVDLDPSMQAKIINEFRTYKI